jgi:phage tail tape-measure protein
VASTDIEIQIKAIDRATAALNRIEKNLRPMAKKVGNVDKQFKKVDKSISKASGSFGKFKGMLAGAITVGGLGAFGKSVLDATGKAEDLKVALETVTGSASNADEAFKVIRSFTEKTPFQVDQVSEAFLKLKSAGLDPSVEMLTMLGDVASVSSDKVGALQAVTNLYSRTVAGGLGVEELDQLADRGIPVYDILRKKLNLTRQDVSDFGKTAEGAAKMTAALSEGFTERFGGGMDRASDNLSVKFSTLSDTIEGLMIKVGEGGFGDAIKKIVSDLTIFLKSNEDLALSLGEKLGNAITKVAEMFTNMGPTLEKLQPIFSLLGTVVMDVLWPGFKLLLDVLSKVATVLAPLAETLAPMLQTGFEAIGTVVTTIIIPAFERRIDVVGNVIDKIKTMIEFIGSGVNAMREMGSGIKDKVGSGLSAAGESVSNFAAGAKQSFWGLYDYVVGNSVIPDLVNGVKSWMGSKLEGVIGSVKNFTEGAKSKFWELYDSVVGNSIIPDMVKEVGQHMDKIPSKMIKPVEQGVRGTQNAFQPLPSNYGSPTANLGGFNFNISNVSANANDSTSATEMRRYVEGVATQVAYNVLRQNTQFGGLI